MAERIYLSPPDVSETERRLLLDAFDSNWISPLGPHVDAFEREFSAHVQMPHAVAMSSGTAALHLALKVVGVRPGDAVIVPTLTFAATANVVSYVGGDPVFIDVSPDTWTLDPKLLEEELASRRASGLPVGAVMTVDLYGQCADYGAIEAICRKFDVPLVEDAAEALGATYGNRKAGQFGACAAFSFNSNKIITTGGGGMLVSQDRALIERVRYLSTQARDPVPHYQHAEVGFNYRMSNLLAAVGRGQLASLSQKLERRRQIKNRYIEALGHLPGFTFMPEARYGRSSQWLSCVLIDTAAAGLTRNDIRDHLERLQIESRPVWKPMHLQPAFNHHAVRGGDVSADLFERGLCLPSGSSLTEENQERVIAGVLEAREHRWFPDRGHNREVESPTDPADMPAAIVAPAAVAALVAEAKQVPSMWHRVLQFHRPIAVVGQLAIIAASYALALLLRFDFAPPDWAWQVFGQTLPILLLIRALVFVPFRLYRGLWRYFSLFDLEHLAAGVFCSTAIFAFYVLSPFGPVERFPRSIIVTDAFLALFLLSGLRMSRRIFHHMTSSSRTVRRRVLVFGAGSGGEMIAREMQRDPSIGYLPVGFIDDDTKKSGLSIHGIPVLGTRADIERIVTKTKAEEVLIAIPGADATTINGIVRSLESFKLPIKTLPHLRNILHGRVELNHIRTLAVEDLIARQTVDLDPAPLRRLIQNRRVLVTGAGGVIGSELCRQLIRWQPAELVLVDRHENSLIAVAAQLRDRRPRAVVRTALLDVLDERATMALFGRVAPDVVWHAATGKDVSLAETHPHEAYRSNVTSTQIVIGAAAAAGAERCIVLSSDKAAAAANVLGMVKRVTEMVVRLSSQKPSPIVSAVRFGNVIGGPGGVVSRFVDQVHNGGPVTVTHPEAKRSFMLMPEAVSMVLQAGAVAKPGEVLAVHMGEPVRILDLATRLIRLAGLIPSSDIQIDIVGLRPGEALIEPFLGEHEKAVAVAGPDVLRISDSDFDASKATEFLAKLEALADTDDHDMLGAGLRSAFIGGPVLGETAAGAVTSTETAEAVGAMTCPKCGSLARCFRVSRFDQNLRKRFTPQRLFRCSSCGWRGWLEPLDVRPGSMLTPGVAERLAQLDLTALDGGERKADDPQRGRG